MFPINPKKELIPFSFLLSYYNTQKEGNLLNY